MHGNIGRYIASSARFALQISINDIPRSGHIFSARVSSRVQVVSSAGEEVFFKIKRSTKLSKLQGAYANKVGKDVSSIRFVVYDYLEGEPVECSLK